MSIKAVNISQTKVIELESDPAHGTPQASKFTIGALGTQAMMAVSAFSTGDNLESAMAYTAVRLGLLGWENVTDEFGAEIPFRAEKATINGFGFHRVVADDLMNMLPASAVAELALAVIQFNSLSEQEEKN